MVEKSIKNQPKKSHFNHRMVFRKRSNVAFEKAVAADGKEHVARACGAKVTAGAVDGADDVLVKENGVLGSSAE